MGTFAQWLGHPRPRTPAIEYLLKGVKGTTPVATPPKSRVHDFPFDQALLYLDGVVSSPPSGSFLARAQVVFAMLLLLWPHRPNSMVSVLGTARLRGSTLLLTPADHKRTPDDTTYRV